MSAVAVLPGDIIDHNSLKVALGAAIFSFFKGLAATKKGDSESASLV